MTEIKIIHSFPTLEVPSSELIFMKLVGAALTVVAVIAGYGVGALATLGSESAPSSTTILVVAVVITACFFTVRIRGTIRQEALLKAVREYVCESLRGELGIDEDELLRAIEGESVTLKSGETITVEREVSHMNLIVSSTAL